jgi:succinyl-CoA:acetate CoA-transferase
MTGASLGNDLDKQLTEAGVLARRMPFQVDSTLRKAINAGEVMFIDQHLSETVEQLRNQQLKLPDIAVIEAVAITEQGHIVPTTSVGNSASFAIFAKQVIVEINLAHNSNLEGLHDIYIPTYRPTRTPIPLVKVDDRIGSTAIPIRRKRSSRSSSPTSPTRRPPCCRRTPKPKAIADHLINFLKQEVDAGRMTNKLGPLQAGIGNIANAVMCGLIDSPFEDLTMYSEVLQDSTFDLIDAGKLSFASGSSITLSSGATPTCSATWSATRTNWCCARRRSPTTRKWCVAWASSASTPRWSSTSTATSTPPTSAARG